jgi:hypothetical protein
MIGVGFGNFQSVTQVPFSFGNALKFDGANDQASATSIKTITGTYCVFFWIKITNQGVVFNISSSSYLFYPQSVKWYWQNFSPTESFLANQPFDTWLAVTVSRDVSNLCTLFVNGVQIDTCTRIGTATFKDIGGFGGARINGILDELYIYDGIEADVNDNIAFWNNGNGIDLRTRAGFETPDRYYSFNEEDDATIVTDAGSDGANLTLTNFSTPPAYFIPH